MLVCIFEAALESLLDLADPEEFLIVQLELSGLVQDAEFVLPLSVERSIIALNWQRNPCW